MRIFDLNGDFTQISFGAQVKLEGIIGCQLQGKSIAVLTSDFYFFLIENYDAPNPIKLESVVLDSNPHCWALMSDESGSCRLIISHLNEVLIADKDSCKSFVSAALIIEIVG